MDEMTDQEIKKLGEVMKEHWDEMVDRVEALNKRVKALSDRVQALEMLERLGRRPRV